MSFIKIRRNYGKRQRRIKNNIKNHASRPACYRIYGIQCSKYSINLHLSTGQIDRLVKGFTEYLTMKLVLLHYLLSNKTRIASVLKSN